MKNVQDLGDNEIFSALGEISLLTNYFKVFKFRDSMLLVERIRRLVGGMEEARRNSFYKCFREFVCDKSINFKIRYYFLYVMHEVPPYDDWEKFMTEELKYGEFIDFLSTDARLYLIDNIGNGLTDEFIQNYERLRGKKTIPYSRLTGESEWGCPHARCEDLANITNLVAKGIRATILDKKIHSESRYAFLQDILSKGGWHTVALSDAMQSDECFKEVLLLERVYGK